MATSEEKTFDRIMRFDFGKKTIPLMDIPLLFKACPDCKEITVFGMLTDIKDWVSCDNGAYFVRKCKKCGHEDRLVLVGTTQVCGHGAGI